MLLCVDVTDADDVVKLGKAARVVYVCFFFLFQSCHTTITVIIRHISGVVRYVPFSLSLPLYQPKHSSPI